MSARIVRPPIAKKQDHNLTAHGQSRVDPYYWLRDDKRESSDVITYLEAENDYAAALLAPLQERREQILSELRSRIKESDTHVPYRMGNYIYNHRYLEGHEYRIHVRRPLDRDDKAHEQILLDENTRAAGHSYYDLASIRISPNESLLAVGEDTVGRRIHTIRFYDIDRGTWLSDEIEGTTGSCCWAEDNRQVLYVRKHPQTLRSYQVWRHTLGTPTSSDTLVYEEADEEFLVQIYNSRTKKFIFIASRQTTCTEVQYIDAEHPESPPRVILPRERHHEYSVDHAGGLFYIRTNLGAKNFKLVTATAETLSDPQRWQEKIPHRENTLLGSSILFEHALVSLEYADANSRLVIYPLDDGERRDLDFDEEVYMVDFDINREWATSTFRFVYQSLTTPATIVDYDLITEARTQRKQLEILGGFDANNYVAKRIEARARDGQRIPMSLVYRKGLDRAHPQPTYLYGYGAYGASSSPYFSRNRLSLLDRGFIFVIAHIRGGQECARRWYEEGKLLQKMNTFTDFIDCAEHLVAEGWTTPEQMVAIGGSAGGLLVGAVANMRPDLFRAVVAHVPFVDVVTTMLDESIPLTTFEYDEWGNPNDKLFFDYMMQYSPYDNVVAQTYPEMFITAGLHDSQVQYWEPAKWVAKLRTHAQGDGQILLKTNMDAGHGGASGRFRVLEDLADEYAWVLNRLGIEDET